MDTDHHRVAKKIAEEFKNKIFAPILRAVPAGLKVTVIVRTPGN